MLFDILLNARPFFGVELFGLLMFGFMLTRNLFISFWCFSRRDWCSHKIFQRQNFGRRLSGDIESNAGEEHKRAGKFPRRSSELGKRA